jgi:hypothetical protein
MLLNDSIKPPTKRYIGVGSNVMPVAEKKQKRERNRGVESDVMLVAEKQQYSSVRNSIEFCNKNELVNLRNPQFDLHSS